MHMETKYLVSLSKGRAVLRVLGHASYLNCVGVGDFFGKAIELGAREIAVDLAQCAGMDSTFLGTLAGGALKLMAVGAKMSLVNVGERNLELAKNLGLENIMSISAPEAGASSMEPAGEELPSGKAAAENILNAHETLAGISPENEAKFEDVISFLKRETRK